MDLIASIFQAIAQFFGFMKQDQDYRNSVDIKSNVEAETIAKDKKLAIVDINDPDLEKLRKDVAE